MKTITIKQPWASLIVEGIKDIENRTWQTKFRGRVLVHAGQTKYSNTWDLLSNKQYDSIPQEKRIEINNGFEYGAIIGSVEIVDCVINHESIWAEKSEITLGALSMGVKPIHNLVLANPIIFPEPIPAKGKLSFWDYENIGTVPASDGGHDLCVCNLPVKLENQVMPMGDGTHRCRYCGGKWYR